MKKKICFFSFLLPFLSMMAIFIGKPPDRVLTVQEIQEA